MEKPYLYTLSNNYVYQSKLRLNLNYKFKQSGTSWLDITRGGSIVINKGYSWDGCSPKITLNGAVLGVPDGPINPVTGLPRTYHASLLHDALLQASTDPAFPLTRQEVDQIFYDVLKRDGFKLAWLYYNAVKHLGGFYSRYISHKIK